MKRLFAEWESQECLIFALPHENSDWALYLDEILDSYKLLIKTVSNFEHCLVICDDKKNAKKILNGIDNITLLEIKTNDTWIRDFGPIDILHGEKIVSYDFIFNAWGGKFDSSLDNKVNKLLFNKNHLQGELLNIPIVLEGGSIDSNGAGTILTTSKCLLEQNRNPEFKKKDIDKNLKELFGLKNIIWLENGFLKGDDTDSHVDTLARFIKQDTIVYSTCENKDDEHYEELQKMEDELKQTSYNLIALPIPSPIYHDNHRLPATYVNFIFINKAIIVPTYNDKNDKVVLDIFKNALPNHEVIGIDARVFIRQHGSLHCATMNRYLGKR